jgi:hypothetical protein
VIAWTTNRDRQIAWAVRNYTTAIGAGDLAHDGHPRATEHVRNARKKKVNVFDDEHQQMHTISKDRAGRSSPRKIDAAMANVLAWECRGDAIAAGATTKPFPITCPWCEEFDGARSSSLTSYEGAAWLT